MTASIGVSPSPRPLLGSCCVTPLTVSDTGSPSASVAPVSVMVFSLWFGRHKFGPAVTAVQTGLWFSVVLTVHVLFVGSGSFYAPVTVPVFAIWVPALPAITVIVNETVAPFANVAATHVTVPAARVHPDDDDTYVEFAGSVSETVTGWHRRVRGS